MKLNPKETTRVIGNKRFAGALAAGVIGCVAFLGALTYLNSASQF